MKTKNIFKALALAMLMPAMLLTTACSNEDNLVNNAANTENTINKGYALPVTVNVTRQGDATTRATYIDNGDGTGSLAFSAGDKLFVRGYYNDYYNEFAGTLEYDTESGKFSGTIYTDDDTYSTYEALFAASEKTSATLLPAGYEGHGYLVIEANDPDVQYDDYVEGSNEYTLATSKADGVAQFSYEEATEYDDGFALSPNNAILNFTITGLAASTSVNVSLTSMAYNITGTVTTDGDGNAKFAAGIMGGLNLQPFSLTVGGKNITIVSSDKDVAKGKIYNITRSAGPETIVWNSSNWGEHDYDADTPCTIGDVTLTINGVGNYFYTSNNYAYLQNNNEEGFEGNFTFTAPTGKKFTKIEIDIDDMDVDSWPSLGTGWSRTENGFTWTGSASSTVKLFDSDKCFGNQAYMDSFTFYVTNE